VPAVAALRDMRILITLMMKMKMQRWTPKAVTAVNPPARMTVLVVIDLDRGECGMSMILRLDSWALLPGPATRWMHCEHCYSSIDHLQPQHHHLSLD